MKKIVIYFMVAISVFLFSACANGNENSNSQSSITDNKHVEAIAAEISKQAEENKITKSVASFYIPKILVNSSEVLNPKILKNDDNGDIVISFHDYNDPIPMNIDKYSILDVRMTCFGQEQSTSLFIEDEETIKLWNIYSSDGKEFLFAINSDENDVDKYLINLVYFIDSKTHVFISANVKDKIDNESKVIAVFKDFECMTLGDLKN